MQRPVAITGLGTVCGLGVGVVPLWEALCAGKSALAPATRLDATGFRSRLAAEAKDFSAKDFVPKSYRKAVKVMARDIELAVGAARCAVDDAKLVTRNGAPDGDGAASQVATTYPGNRMGCQIGAGLIAAETDELSSALATAVDASGRFQLPAWGTASAQDGTVGTGGMNNLQPLWLLKYLPNMLACHVTIIHGAEGPSNTITCAEASGLLSLGESCRVIERGAADLCFSGSAESKVNLMGFLRLQLAGRLADTGEETDGSKIVRPFDPASSGTILGEGSGILIAECLETARARGARVYCQIAGFGAGQSSRLELEPVGAGPELGLQYAIENALEDAGVRPDQIDAIVPHGAGVPERDRAEADALRAVFGARLKDIELITLTPAIGECMAGNGGVMTAVAAMALHTQTLPARLHSGTAPGDLRAGAAASRKADLGHVLVCSTAMGGQNAAIVLKRNG
jgi:3-oxoacyl-[acyl-carrier-protein] synthase II